MLTASSFYYFTSTMSLLFPADIQVVGEELQNHEPDLQSLAWRNIEIDENKMAALRRVIEEIVENTDNLPDQIIEAASTILTISSGINAIMIHSANLFV
jgi:hypothetical protein